MSKEKVEMIEKKFLNYKDERYEVQGVFSHQMRNYITIDVKDTDGNPYVICDSSDTLYTKIEKVKVPKESKEPKEHKDIKWMVMLWLNLEEI